MENVIIIGTGCAGLTAAIYTSRANLNPLVLEGTQPGGQLTQTSEVENFPGFPEGIDGYSLMDNLRKQASKFGTRFEHAFIDKVDLSGECKKLYAGDKVYEAQSIIVATGASPRMFGLPGEKEMFGGKGVSTCATCDAAFYRNMDVMVIGGGDSAAEEALFLTRFASKVYVVHRRDELRASKIMSDRLVAHEKVEMLWNTEPQEFVADEQGYLKGVTIKNNQSGEESLVECKGAFVAIGHIPNTKAFEGAIKLDDQGYFAPEAGSMVQTDVEGVYVAGDCADTKYRQAITAAGMGCQSAIEVERWLAENE